MCRLAAIPPGMTAEQALEIVEPFGRGNKDGTGVAYSDGSQVLIKKWPMPLEKVLKDDLPLFNHLPSKSWTIFHVRLATHGEVERKNTHPFMHDGMAFCHNGIYGAHRAIKEALGNRLILTSETDSDVGAGFLRVLGPERFCEANQGIHGGVFLGLTPTGGLWVSVLSGDLEYAPYGDTWVLASSLPYKIKDQIKVEAGYMIFENDGSYRRGEFRQSNWGSGYTSGGYDYCYDKDSGKYRKVEAKTLTDPKDAKVPSWLQRQRELPRDFTDEWDTGGSCRLPHQKHNHAKRIWPEGE